MPLLLNKTKRARLDWSFLGGTLPSGLSFTRSTIGMRFNSSGVLVSDAINTPRFNYSPYTLTMRGLLIEPQRTNATRNNISLGTPRTDFATNSSWCTKGVTATQVTDTYIGTVMRVTEDTSTGGHVLLSPIFDDPGANSPVVMSMLINPGSCSQLCLTHKMGYETANDGFARLDFSTGTATVVNASVLSSPQLEYIGQGWWRASMVYQYPTGSGFRTVSAGTLDGSGNMSSFAGTGRVFYMADPQTEIGYTSRTSTIQTTSSVVTRAADVLSCTIPSGVSALRYTFDDGSTQVVSVSPGAYTVPTNLTRANIQRIRSV